jgi:hypothetical protein
MTYPHVTIEERLSLLELAVARLQKDLAARSGDTAPQAAPKYRLPKFAQEWFDSWDERGMPRAIVAAEHQCRSRGGAGPGDWGGDPEVRKDPKQWKEGSMVGRKYSMCPPKFLTMLASLEEFKALKTLEAGEQDKQKYVTYGLRNAALAKGWAKILSDPMHRPGAELDDEAVERLAMQADSFDDSSDIPF